MAKKKNLKKVLARKDMPKYDPKDLEYRRDKQERQPELDEAKSNIEAWWLTRERDARMENKMPGSEYRIQMSKVKTKDKNVRKAVGSVFDNKPVDKKLMGHPEVEKAKKYMGEMARAALLNKVVKQTFDYSPEKVELKTFADYDI